MKHKTIHIVDTFEKTIPWERIDVSLDIVNSYLKDIVEKFHIKRKDIINIQYFTDKIPCKTINIKSTDYPDTIQEPQNSIVYSTYAVITYWA